MHGNRLGRAVVTKLLSRLCDHVIRDATYKPHNRRHCPLSSSAYEYACYLKYPAAGGDLPSYMISTPLGLHGTPSLSLTVWNRHTLYSP